MFWMFEQLRHCWTWYPARLRVCRLRCKTDIRCGPTCYQMAGRKW